MNSVTHSLCVNLTATGIAAGTGVTATNVREIFQRKKYDPDFDRVATIFADDLERALEAENARCETNEITGAADNWTALVEEITGLSTDDASKLRDYEHAQISHLFADEEDAIVQIVEAIATV